MKTRDVTRIAFMAVILCCVFQMFANILYIECITFTILLFSCVFSKRDACMACIVFSFLNMLMLGVTPWTLLYLLIYPLYAFCIASSKHGLLKHPICLYSVCGILSFLTGQVLDLPFLLFSKEVTMLYILLGLKTSIIQGILSFVSCMFLFDPMYRRLSHIEERK